MTELESLSEEERSLFRPFTRESLKAIEVRIAEENEKQKELERKRAEGEVRTRALHSTALLIHWSLFSESRFLSVNIDLKSFSNSPSESPLGPALVIVSNILLSYTNNRIIIETSQRLGFNNWCRISYM